MNLPIDDPGSTEAVLLHLGQALQRLRLERDLTQAQLAREAGISAPTVKRLEAGESVQLSHWLKVLRALGQEAALLELLPIESPSPVQAWEQRKTTRKRASGSRSPEAPSPWHWGDADGEEQP
ncbi:MAG: helix-turn-helix transcriptional regulator [Planctomycetota bacterium]